MIFVIGTPSASIPFSRIYLDRLWSPEIKQIANHWEKFFIRYWGVRLAWFSCCWSSYPLLACLNWFKGFELLAWLFLVGRLVTRTYWVATRTSSSSIEYLFARLNRSSIVVGGFFARNLKNGVPELMLFLKIYKMVSLLQNSTWSTAYPNHFMKSLEDLFSCILMFCKVLIFYLWWAEHR